MKRKKKKKVQHWNSIYFMFNEQTLLCKKGVDDVLVFLPACLNRILILRTSYILLLLKCLECKFAIQWYLWVRSQRCIKFKGVTDLFFAIAAVGLPFTIQQRIIITCYLLCMHLRILWRFNSCELWGIKKIDAFCAVSHSTVETVSFLFIHSILRIRVGDWNLNFKWKCKSKNNK